MTRRNIVLKLSRRFSYSQV